MQGNYVTYVSADRSVSVDEVARHFGVSRRTVWRRVRNGDLPRLYKLGTSQASRAQNAKAFFRASELNDFVNRCAASRPATASGSSSGGKPIKDQTTMANLVSNKTKVESTFVVNGRTGVLFVAHPDMFQCQDPATGRWMTSDNLEFFTDEKAAKEFSDSIIAEVRKESGIKADAVINVPTPAAADGDSRKLTSKAEVARTAKERFGVEIVTARTRKNIDSQFAIAHTASATGADAQAAVQAMASLEGDQLLAAA